MAAEHILDDCCRSSDQAERGSGALFVDGTLNTNGTVGNRVVFTSLRDDTLGENTNEAEGAVAPAPGDWLVMGFLPPVQPPSNRPSCATAAKAGLGWDQNRSRFGPGSIAFNHSTLELGNGIGLNVIENGSLSVSNSTFQGNNGNGINFINYYRTKRACDRQYRLQ